MPLFGNVTCDSNRLMQRLKNRIREMSVAFFHLCHLYGYWTQRYILICVNDKRENTHFYKIFSLKLKYHKS